MDHVPHNSQLQSEFQNAYFFFFFFYSGYFEQATRIIGNKASIKLILTLQINNIITFFVKLLKKIVKDNPAKGSSILNRIKFLIIIRI